MSNTPSYSRDEVIAEITSYYKFLTTVHLPSSAIKFPPSTGWPEITPEYLAPLNKNDTVIDLIKHLPLIERNEYHDKFCMYAWTAGVDFTGHLAKKMLTEDHDTDLLQPMEDEGIIPAHVATIATPSEGRDGSWIHIDTERGTAVLCDLQRGPKKSRTSLSQDRQGKGDEWREYATYTIKDFFQFLRQEFKDFKVLATSEQQVEPSTQEDERFRKIRGIFEEEGIFTDRYNKESAIARVSEVEN